MAFGFNRAPAHFQALMNRALEDGPPLRHGTYLDDCNVGGRTLRECWHNTLEAMWRLLKVGLPMNAWKLKLLQTSLEMLGVVLSRDTFYLGKKALAKAFESTLPRTLKELQGLVGKLNFASQFVPNY